MSKWRRLVGLPAFSGRSRPEDLELLIVLFISYILENNYHTKSIPVSKHVRLVNDTSGIRTIWENVLLWYNYDLHLIKVRVFLVKNNLL